MLPLLLCAYLSLATATPALHASTFAGSTSTAVFPPPDATDTAINTYFPDAEQFGFPGPTPTGDEARVIATAPAAAQKSDTYPLINPLTQSSEKTPSFNPIRYWGNLSPWFSVGSAFGLPDTSPQLPDGCELTQVHLLHRHGARYPTSNSAPSQFAALLHSKANTTGFSATGPLEFLNTWTYKLGAEILTPFGREQVFDLGVAFRVKYGDLLKGFTDLPVFRTTSEAYFFGVQQFPTSYHQLIQIEDTGFNSTLAPYDACANANNAIADIGTAYTTNWTAVYLARALPRLQAHLRGVTLDPASVQAMQQLCAYETVALGYSAFCALFTEEEWRGYEYANDLQFWYGSGPGNPAAAAAQGIGYVQELVARLTQTPLTAFDTTLNATLDGNNVAFPLNQPIYVDATHDTVISTIVVALNFTSMAKNGPLPADRIPTDQTYFAQHIAPFASNLVAQVLSCPAKSSSSSSKEPFIRFLLNDGVVPLTGIAHCAEDKDSLCALGDFVQGMKERIAEVDFAYDCFANYTVPVPDTIIDGRMHK